MQQQVLDLHYDGYSETAIAEQLGIALISLQRIRKTIASLAEGLILGDDQTRRGSQKSEVRRQEARGKRQEARGKRQEARKNSFEKWKLSGWIRCRLRLVRKKLTLLQRLTAIEVEFEWLQLHFAGIQTDENKGCCVQNRNAQVSRNFEWNTGISMSATTSK